MAWNYCPWCSHRIYMHNDEGCTSVEENYRPCEDNACDKQPVLHGHLVDEPCECKKGHPLMVDHWLFSWG